MNCRRSMTAKVSGHGRKKPYELHSLTQGAFVLKKLERGVSRDKLIRTFLGDEWTVDFWIFFLKKYGWMEQDSTGRWTVTDVGRIWLEKCSN